MTAMSLQRYQFTIRQLRVFVAESAAFFLFLALSPGGFFTFAFVYVVTRFLHKRGVAGAGILGATMAILFVLVGFVTAGCIDVYFFGIGKPGGFDGLGPVGASVAESACGLIFGAVISIALYLNSELPKRYSEQVCPTDASCGPIVWHRLDDPRLGP
jgi:hypothetical protein